MRIYIKKKIRTRTIKFFNEKKRKNSSCSVHTTMSAGTKSSRTARKLEYQKKNPFGFKYLQMTWNQVLAPGGVVSSPFNQMYSAQWASGASTTANFTHFTEKMCWLSMTLKGRFWQEQGITGTSAQSICRLIMLWDANYNGGVSPLTAIQILYPNNPPTNTTSDAYQMQNMDFDGRVDILYDKRTYWPKMTTDSNRLPFGTIHADQFATSPIIDYKRSMKGYSSTYNNGTNLLSDGSTANINTGGLLALAYGPANVDLDLMVELVGIDG